MLINKNNASQSTKPRIYTSFVSSIDGKVFVKKDGYWPIGSQEDYRRFTALRAAADIIIDGKNTAQVFADRTIQTIHSESFLTLRKDLRKTTSIQYAVLTEHPGEDLVEKIQNQYGFQPMLLTSAAADIPTGLQECVEIKREKEFDLQSIVKSLAEMGYCDIFIDGGPSLITSLVKENLLDEIYLTISPKIFGGENGVSMTMAEGQMIPPDLIQHWRLQNVESVDDEVFLHYAKP